MEKLLSQKLLHRFALWLVAEEKSRNTVRKYIRDVTKFAAKQRGEATVSLKGKTREIFLVKSLQKKLLLYVAEQGIYT